MGMSCAARRQAACVRVSRCHPCAPTVRTEQWHRAARGGRDTGRVYVQNICIVQNVQISQIEAWREYAVKEQRPIGRAPEEPFNGRGLLLAVQSDSLWLLLLLLVLVLLLTNTPSV